MAKLYTPTWRYDEWKVRKGAAYPPKALFHWFICFHSFPLFAKVLAVFAFCIGNVFLKAQLVSIAMPIDCWKTCSSTYANVNSPTKSLGKIVKYSSPKLTNYYIQMGRKIICQCICRCPSIDEANGQWVCRCLPIHEKK